MTNNTPLKTFPSVKILQVDLKPYDFSTKYLLELSTKYPDDINRFSHFIKLLHNANVIEIDNRLIPLIENTDNKIFYRPLFFKYIFINTDLKIVVPTEVDHLYWIYVIKYFGLLDTGDDWLILTLLIDPRNNTLTKRTLRLLKTDGEIDDPKIPIETPAGVKTFDMAEQINIERHLRIMACNFIDLVECNDADLDVITIKPTKEQQNKRLLRNKSILPTKVFIRPRKHFVKYIQEYTAHESLRLPPRYLVRGHWRHYRSERYSEKLRQKPQWIKPYYKGMGLIKQNVYKVVP